VDGETAASYAERLDENLRSLLDRFKSGTYWAPPVRRVHIPKGDGAKTRPIGIPTFEDKVLQRAVTMVLEAIYEQEFLDGSYGFRPARSAHDALQALWDGSMKVHGGWVLELDIERFFDTMVHEHLRNSSTGGYETEYCAARSTSGSRPGPRSGRSATRTPARHTAGSALRSWRTSTCTRCSTRGSRPR
jgi:retron-type reverse transcriptase